MNIIGMIILFFSSSIVLADSQEIVLEKSSIRIGKMPQENKEPVSITYDLVRTHKTPKWVNIKAIYNYEIRGCVRGQWSQGVGQHVYICTKYGWKKQVGYLPILIRSRKAPKLGKEDKEIYRITLTQKSYRSNIFHIDAEVITGSDQVKIKKINSGIRRFGIVVKTQKK